MESLVWLIPLLPLGGFLVNGFIGRFFPRILVSLIGCGTVFAAFILAVVASSHVRGQEFFTSTAYDWINIGGSMPVRADLRLTIDHLTSVMMLVVTGVGFLIHVYSASYMSHDKRFSRFFCYLNLFTAFMLILVMGSNLLLMFVGWEGVGLCSYLLIGFWFEETANAKAGMKAFIVNRIGDFTFTIGVLTLFAYLGTKTGIWTVDFQEIKAAIEAHPSQVSVGVLTFVGIMMFGGATGKSAQIPLFVWLPDAMAGPTPVSALIHAATMVTAGVYMIARMNFLYILAPAALTVVAVVGGLTALFAGTIGVAQNDIKKVLAYSTVSQLGFMFMGVGVGAFAAGIFHLMTHAFFKACLFLGAGSVSHGMEGVVGKKYALDITKMGGLYGKMKVTAMTFIVASAALAGLPPLAGFFSKDEILWKAFSTENLAAPWVGKMVWLFGAIAAFFTAFYMTRLCIKVFFAKPAWKVESGGGAAVASTGLPDWMDDEGRPEKLQLKGGDKGKKHEGRMDMPTEHGFEIDGQPPPAPPPPPHHGDAGHGHEHKGGHAEEPALSGVEGGSDVGHGHGHEPHESPWPMTGVLAVLAFLSIVGGWIGWPHALAGSNHFEKWLEPVFERGKPHAAASHAPAPAPHEGKGEHESTPPMEYGLMFFSVVIAAAGVGAGYFVFMKKPEIAERFVERRRGLYELVRDKYRIDELYDRIAVEPLLNLNEELGRFDFDVIDGAVNGAAHVSAATANHTGYFDNEAVDGFVNGTAGAVREAGRRIRHIQSGNIKTYLTTALVGGLFVIAFFCLYFLMKPKIHEWVSRWTS